MLTTGGDTASSEATLVARASDGDATAISALFDLYAGAIYGYGLRRLGQHLLAEELVQRVMTQVWRRASTYRPERGSVRTWVFTIARTSMVDIVRAEPRAEPVGSVPDQPIDDELDVLIRAEAVRAALARLTPAHREVLDLAYFNGLSQREIATRTGEPLGTVKSRTYYALRALRLACEEAGVTP